MTLLADHQIEALCIQVDGTMKLYSDSDVARATSERKNAMISPFSRESVRKNSKGAQIPSYGLSSYGYDISLGNDFKVFTNVNNSIVDPMNFDESCFVEVHKEDDDYIIIPPNSFILAVSKEYIRMPDNVLAVCLGKSTYARCGIICIVTPLEPGWHGHITLEFSNTTTLPAKMYVGAGCAQLLFHKGDTPCEVTYADRNGKYQGQVGITLPK